MWSPAPPGLGRCPRSIVLDRCDHRSQDPIGESTLIMADPRLATEVSRGGNRPRAISRTGPCWEGAPDIEFFRQATWALVHERPARAINRAGTPAEPPIFVLSVTVPGGAM